MLLLLMTVICRGSLLDFINILLSLMGIFKSWLPIDIVESISSTPFRRVDLIVLILLRIIYLWSFKKIISFFILIIFSQIFAIISINKVLFQLLVVRLRVLFWITHFIIINVNQLRVYLSFLYLHWILVQTLDEQT